ncbi:hypothetical protein [Pantoea sp. C2G6]|uniref:hypothetical protein n=1 Tax=Pantoea sp. C2G6 TaxID=3243084 RepID=UPI003ED98870
MSEKLKDPDAAAIVKYLNGSDLKFLKDNITEGDRVMDVIMTPTSWPVAIMGGKAIITNAVNNTKEQLIAVGVGAGLGAGIQYGPTGEVKLSDVIGSGVIGAITAGKGYNPTMAWNAAGGYYQAEISGDDPFMAALLSKAGASAGYAAGNVLKVQADKIFNPVSKQYEWVPIGVWTITKPVPQSSIPAISANVIDSTVSGVVGDNLKSLTPEEKMNINKSKKSIWLLVFLCLGMCLVLMIGGIFSYLLKGWLIWDFDKPFPFGKEEVVKILKISLLGVPTGLVFWIFDIR